MNHNPQKHRNILAVNEPREIQVGEDRLANPFVVFVPQPQTVTLINDKWRIDDEWWRREPVSRMYYDVLLASGKQLVIFKDLVSGRWYRQNY